MATVKKTMKKSAPKKAMMKKAPAMPSMGGGAMMKKGGKVKKAQAGMTMKQLKTKYPDVDTTAKGDVRGSEMNAYAPKKALQKYNDTYNAFEKKFKGGPAKDKPTKISSPAKKPMKMGGKMSKKK